jgi:hypothetical protein
MAIFQIQTVAVNEPATRTGVDLEMETFPRICHIQEKITFQEFWLNSYKFTPMPPFF